MNKNLILFSFIFFIFDSVHSKIENKIILKVENEIVTTYEVKNKILSTLVLSNKEINQNNINSLKNQVLEILIQNKLKKIELSKYNINLENSNVNSYLNSISENNLIGLKEKFKNYSINYDLFLEDVKTQLRWQKLIYQIYSSKIEIDENIINQDLRKIMNNKKNIEEFEISEIEILINNEDLNERVSKILKEIDEQGFEKTAVSFSSASTASNKGYLGWINSKSLSTEVYKYISVIEPGEITKPLKIQNGFLILKLNNKRVSKVENINLPKLKKDLVNQKKNELFNLYSRSHLSKLKNNSLIDYK